MNLNEYQFTLKYRRLLKIYVKIRDTNTNQPGILYPVVEKNSVKMWANFIIIFFISEQITKPVLDKCSQIFNLQIS